MFASVLSSLPNQLKWHSGEPKMLRAAISLAAKASDKPFVSSQEGVENTTGGRLKHARTLNLSPSSCINAFAGGMAAAQAWRSHGCCTGHCGRLGDGIGVAYLWGRHLRRSHAISILFRSLYISIPD